VNENYRNFHNHQNERFISPHENIVMIIVFS